MDKKLLSVKEKKSIEYYNKFADEWSGKHSGGTLFDPEMQQLFELFPNGSVLEIGAGHGEDAKKLTGHYGVNNYLGIEPAQGLLEIARERNPGVKFENKSIYELEDVQSKFDVFWISAMIIHVPKEKLNSVLQIVKNVVRVGGGGFISIMEGVADMKESRPGRHYSLWQQEEFERNLKDVEFEVVKKRRIETKASPWLTYLLRVV